MVKQSLTKATKPKNVNTHLTVSHTRMNLFCRALRLLTGFKGFSKSRPRSGWMNVILYAFYDLNGSKLDVFLHFTK